MLPPGDYKLQAYGSLTHYAWRPLHVEPGDGVVVVEPIDLRPTQLALLRGKPAPALRGVVAWKNSEELKLADLKGRYVLLDFWGHRCAPCVASMPRLFEIHDRFPEDKLVIIGVHVGIKGDDEVSTVEKLDAALLETRRNVWEERDLPFPVALVDAEDSPHIAGEGTASSLAAADYGITGYPTLILIDREGRVVGKAHEFVKSEDGFAKLAKLLDAN